MGSRINNYMEDAGKKVKLQVTYTSDWKIFVELNNVMPYLTALTTSLKFPWEKETS